MLRLVLPLIAACAAFVACTPSSSSSPISLRASAKSAPADGITAVTIAAAVPAAPPGAVIELQVQGVGLLSMTNVEVVNDAASVTLYAPFESELGSSAAVTSTVVAAVTVGGAVLRAKTDVVFTVPTDGAPSLSAHTDPDRVVAGGADPITLVVDGRRLTSDVVTLHADVPAVSVPSSLTLTDNNGVMHGELAIDPPADPADVNVTISSPGADDVVVTLHFTASDAAAFDLNGTFAEIQYGVVQIGGLIFLSPDPQCVIAPTLLLSHIVQVGNHLEVSSTTCDVQMPSVSVVIVGESTTTVGPGFVDATNHRATGPLEADLTSGALGAPFAPTAASFGAALVVGAELADPDNDALPTTPDDDRVRDDDADGNPGVTIHNSNEGDQYAVFRTKTSSMSGVIANSDAIDGSVSGVTETNILNGGSGGLSPTVIGMPSPFSFRRVDGRNGAVDISARDGDPSSITCDDVKAYASELTQLAPPPDTSTACN